MSTMEISFSPCLELPDLLRPHETVTLGEAGPSGLVTCTGGSLKGEVGREGEMRPLAGAPQGFPKTF